MIPGKRFTLADGKAYVVPPLTFRQMRTLDEDGTTAALYSNEPARSAAAGLRLIAQALGRNYPEINDDTVQDVVDAGLIQAVLPVVLGRLKPEEREVDAPTPRAGE